MNPGTKGRDIPRFETPFEHLLRRRNDAMVECDKWLNDTIGKKDFVYLANEGGFARVINWFFLSHGNR